MKTLYVICYLVADILAVLVESFLTDSCRKRDTRDTSRLRARDALVSVRKKILGNLGTFPTPCVS